MEKAEVVIIGGGIIGCAIAYELRKGFGVKSIVVERSQVGAGASSVAAGMLAPLTESGGPGPMLDLGIRSLSMYVSILAELREEGLDVDFMDVGILRVAFTEEEEQELQRRFQWQREAPLKVLWVTAEEALRLEEHLNPQVRCGLYSLDEPSLSSRKLVTALSLAAAENDVKFMVGSIGISLETKGSRVTGVRLDDGTVINTDYIVLAAGPWTGFIAQGVGLNIPAKPVRGQLAAVSSIPVPIERVIYGHHRGYLVPRPDGTITMGGTMEEVGFDNRVTASGLGRILTEGTFLVPSLQDSTFVGAWSGLRPGSPDGLPIIGPIPGWEGICVATGHFRNGILLAPVTARLVCEIIMGGEPSMPIEPFSPGRFMAS